MTLEKIIKDMEACAAGYDEHHYDPARSVLLLNGRVGEGQLRFSMKKEPGG